TSNDGRVTGTGGVSSTSTIIASTCGPNGPSIGQPQTGGCCDPPAQVTGTKDSLAFTGSHPGLARSTYTYAFSGAFNGNEIVGTFTLTVDAPPAPPLGSYGGTGKFPVTLR